ncbi:MAG TPA: hypothetical protein VGJ60_08020 [Chloroflexota bacterium]|jgi:hypothetical protein
MNMSRVSRIVAAVSVMVFAPLGGVVSAQTPATTTTSVPCAIAVGPLTADQESLVNDYQILVAKANSKHTAVPIMPEDVFVLIGCISPASQTGGQTATTTATTSASTSTTTTPAAPTPTPTASTSSTVTFTCPANGLSKDQLSQINDYEILVARANSKHTEVPQISPEVAAFIACE